MIDGFQVGVNETLTRVRASGISSERERTFAANAWSTILFNQRDVVQTDPNAAQVTGLRSQKTVAVLSMNQHNNIPHNALQSLRNALGDNIQDNIQIHDPVSGQQENVLLGIIGSSTNNTHAETNIYDQVWLWARDEPGTPLQRIQLFNAVVRGGVVSCIDEVDGQYVASHKPSCFLCAAVARSLTVMVETKDLSTYDQYKFPAIFSDVGTCLADFVGTTAITIYNGMAPTSRDLALLHLALMVKPLIDGRFDPQIGPALPGNDYLVPFQTKFEANNANPDEGSNDSRSESESMDEEGPANNASEGM